MSFTWLIDGYNLMGALGLIQGKLAPSGLQQGRRTILDLLADHFQNDAAAVLVIFDAARSPRGASPEQQHRGIQVRFAKGRDEADDLLEELIRDHPTPAKLTVVSSDHRVQRAARRRDERFLDCQAFLDWLERPRGSRADTRPSEDDKPTPDDLSFWLRAFERLKDSPEARELFDDFGTGG